MFRGLKDFLLAADVIYFEEQDPLVNALQELLSPETLLLLAYRERTPADRQYLEEVILPKLEAERIDYRTERGCCEIYMGRKSLWVWDRQSRTLDQRS